MKRNAFVRIILYALLAAVLTAVLVFGIQSKGYYIGFGSKGATVADGEIKLEASSIRNLEILWSSGTVTICPGYSDEICFYEIRPDGCQTKMAYSLEGDTLTLYNHNAKFGIHFGPSVRKELVITVPKHWQGQSLSIDGSSLQLQLQALQVNYLTIDGSSCSLSLSGNVNRLEVDGSSCDIDINGCVNKVEIDGSSCQLNFTGSLDRLEMDGSSCEAYVNSRSPVSHISIDGSSCELELILPEGCGFTASLDGSSTKLHTDLPCVHKDDRYIYDDGYCSIDMDGSSCSLTVSESKECVHEWDLGEPVIAPGTNEQQWIFTCIHCAAQEFRNSRCEHQWIMVGSGLIVYRCSICGEFKK